LVGLILPSLCVLIALCSDLLNFVVAGILACLDGYMNIAMEQTEEYVNGQLKNKYGDAFIRGNNGRTFIVLQSNSIRSTSFLFPPPLFFSFFFPFSFWCVLFLSETSVFNSSLHQHFKEDPCRRGMTC